MTQIIGKDGNSYEAQVGLEDYAAAAAEGKSFAQHVNAKFDTDDEKFGTPYEQILASSGLFLREDRKMGLRSPKMSDVLNSNFNMGTLTRNDGSQRDTTLGRLLFPSIIEQIVNEFLVEDNTSYEGMFNRMVAKTTTIDSPRWTQPLINSQANRDEDSNPIAQNALPKNFGSISLSEKSYRIPTVSLGMSITDEALAASSLDLVAIALKEQAIGARGRNIDRGLKGCVLGDVDLGIAALSSFNSSTLDSTCASGNNFITQKAWLKYLRKDWKKLNINWAICSLDTYLLIEGRANKPLYTGNEGTDGRLNSLIVAANPNIQDSLNFFIIDDDSLIGGAGKVVGLDSTRAIQKVVNTSAAYSATEAFVLRKSSAFRVDFSEAYFRLLPGSDDGWRVMNLA